MISNKTKFSRVMPVLVGLLTISSFGHAQVRRDQQGIAVLQQAISAMGGSGNISGITTAALSGHITTYQNGQGSIKQFLAEYDFSNESAAFRHELTDDQGTSIFASGGRRPIFQAANQKAHRLNRHVALAAASFEIPAVVLSLELANPNCEIMYVPEGQGQPLHVRTEDQTTDITKKVTRQDWYFDPNSLLPIRAAYKSPDVNFPAVHTRAIADYLGFQTVVGVAVPTEIRTYADDQLDTDLTIEVTHFNIGLAQGFDMPEN